MQQEDKPGSAFLTKDEEFALARRWRENGDVRAMNRLVEAHIPLARKAIQKWTRRYEEDDLLSEACIGLIKAAEKFEPERGFRFSTYARHWIKSQITEFRLKNDAAVRYPTTAAGRAAFLSGKKIATIYLSDPVAGTDSLTFGDTLVDENPLPDALVERAVDLERHMVGLSQSMHALSDRERMIVEERHLSNDPPTLDDLGAKLGLSKERVRQIEVKSIEKITKAMKKRPVLEAAE